MKVLDVAASRELDRRASEEFGIPSLVLMENAALGAVEVLGERFPSARRVLVLCGPGNNGGDGLAMARHLALRGLEVEVWLVGSRALGGDAAVQETICRRQGLRLRRVEALDDVPAEARGWDLTVDALFGVGLSRPVEGVFASVIDWLTERRAPCLAVDLPSGLFGDRGATAGPHVRADVTVTFEAPKPAHVLPPACDAVGDLYVADLGVPSELAQSAASRMTLVTPDLAASWVGRRPAAAHKGDFGHVLVAAGAPGMGGAAVLAARGAIRGGAGLVTCAVPESVLSTVDAASLESITLGLPADAAGQLSEASVAPVVAAAGERDVLALGPGLGEGDEVARVVRRVVAQTEVPLVLDASALAAFAGRLEELAGRRGAVVLTPHAGELARLLSVSVEEVTADRPASVERAREASGATVLLKGQASLVAGAGGVLVNSTGNPGMATGGSGDVLTGLLAACMARGLEAPKAAALAAFVHGAAGDLAAEEFGQTALAAADLLPCIPRVLRDLERR